MAKRHEGPPGLRARLALARNELKMKQPEFAELLDIPVSTYINTETGWNPINADFIYNLARKTDINLNWLFAGALPGQEEKPE